MTAAPADRPGRTPSPRPQREDLLLLVLGGLSVLAGGLVAAVTGPLGLERGSWAAAYLVLVCGVASIAVGGAQSWLVTTRAPGAAALVQLVAWLTGNAGVLVGTLVGWSAVVVGGGALLVVALLVALLGARRVRHRGLGGAYRAVLVVVAASIPVGLVLSVLRNG